MEPCKGVYLSVWGGARVCAEKVRESDPGRRGVVAHCRKRRSIVRRKEEDEGGGRDAASRIPSGRQRRRGRS